MQADLAAILEELRAREPIFHTPASGSTPEEWKRALAPESWEVGASAFILETLAVRAPVDAAAAGWLTSDHAVRELGPATYLFT